MVECLYVQNQAQCCGESKGRKTTLRTPRKLRTHWPLSRTFARPAAGLRPAALALLYGKARSRYLVAGRVAPFSPRALVPVTYVVCALSSLTGAIYHVTRACIMCSAVDTSVSQDQCGRRPRAAPVTTIDT